MATSVNKWIQVNVKYFLDFSFFLIIYFSVTKILNSILIGGGIAVFIGTSWYV
jgi:hypothetical protein